MVSVQFHWATSNVCNSDSDQVSRCCCECFWTNCCVV